MKILLNNYQLCFSNASVVAMYGIIMCKEKVCAFCCSPVSSKTLNIIIDTAITTDCPTSSPFIPAKIFIAFVQKTANIPM